MYTEIHTLGTDSININHCSIHILDIFTVCMKYIHVDKYIYIGQFSLCIRLPADLNNVLS